MTRRHIAAINNIVYFTKMKWLLPLFIVAFSVLKSPAGDKVYICVGGSAYAYHKTKACGWLQQCTHRVEEVTVAEAQNTYKRKPCKPCYK